VRDKGLSGAVNMIDPLPGGEVSEGFTIFDAVTVAKILAPQGRLKGAA
jgi:hypothetical protein